MKFCPLAPTKFRPLSPAHLTRDVLTSAIVAIFSVNVAAHHFKYSRRASVKGNYRRDANAAPMVVDAISVAVMVLLLVSAFGGPPPGGT